MCVCVCMYYGCVGVGGKGLWWVWGGVVCGCGGGSGNGVGVGMRVCGVLVRLFVCLLVCFSRIPAVKLYSDRLLSLENVYHRVIYRDASDQSCLFTAFD